MFSAPDLIFQTLHSFTKFLFPRKIMHVGGWHVHAFPPMLVSKV
jgi:hypothetical protein